MNIFTSFKEYLFENNSIDTILDKINKDGIESLTDFEKDILKKSDIHSNMEDATIQWLDNNFSNLNTHKQQRKSFGQLKDYILFLDDDMELVFEYDVKNKKLYIPFKDIRQNLGEYFNEKSFIKWFNDKITKLMSEKLVTFFQNI